MTGEWSCSKKEERFGGEISYNSNQKIFALFNLRFFDSDINGNPVRYYYPRELSIFQEPDVVKNGRHVISQFSSQVINGEIDFNTAITLLRKHYKVSENHIEKGFVLECIKEAIRNNRVPESEKINKDLYEFSVEKQVSKEKSIKFK